MAYDTIIAAEKAGVASGMALMAAYAGLDQQTAVEIAAACHDERGLFTPLGRAINTAKSGAAIRSAVAAHRLTPGL